MEVKRKIGIDIDNVLSNFNDVTHIFILSEFGIMSIFY